MIAALLLAASLQHWLVVNDIHLNPFSRAGIVRGADTSPVLWKSTLHEMRIVVPQPRVVVLGGDFLAHHFPSLAQRAHVSAERAALQTMGGIAGDLGRAYPRAQFLVALGNNDDPCGDYRSETSGPYTRALGRIWEPLVDRDGAAPRFSEQFARGGYYTARLPLHGGAAIVLNSVFWSIVYRGGCRSHPRDPGRAELAWLANQLRGRAASDPTELVMHIPPGYDPQSTMLTRRLLAIPFIQPSADATFLSTLGHEGRSVRAIFGAHTHRYDFRVVAGIPMLIGSSVSPVYNNNPAFFDVTIDGGGTIVNVTPYAYDLYDGVWKREPSFDAMYGISSLNTTALREIAHRIRTQPAVRAVWKRAYDVWSWRVGDLDADWVPFACAQTEIGSGYAACAKTSRRTHGLEIALGVGVLLILAAIVYGVRRRRRAD
jgi:hypothetical protein